MCCYRKVWKTVKPCFSDKSNNSERLTFLKNDYFKQHLNAKYILI